MNNNYNIFICYRGTSDDTDRNKIDGKWAALDLYSELSKVDDYHCFFAPKHYKPQDNFKADIPTVLKSVKIAILVLTVGFFDRCSDDDDIVKYELDEILSKDIEIIPVYVDKYCIVEDKYKIEKYFGDKKEKFYHRTGIRYTGIYDFDSNELKKSIAALLAIYDNSLNASEIEEDSIIANIGDIINSSSVTVALNNIITILEDKLSKTNLDMKKLRLDTKHLIDKICKSVVHFSTLSNVWKNQLKPILAHNQDKARIALRDYKKQNQDNRDKVSDFSRGLFHKGEGILTFSQSEYVIDFLSSLMIKPKIKNDCKIYISEGRSKSQFYFEDALEIYEKLERSGFNNRIIITDCSIYQLLEEKKITKILLGACSVELRDSLLHSFINAAGTETILMLAEKFNIPVYVISASDKHLLQGFEPRELQLSIKEFKKKHPQITFDSVDYVKVQRSPNITFISERGLDNANMTKYFYEDIFKDTREAVDSDDGHFIKICNETEYTVEHLVLNSLEKAGCKVAGLITSSDARRRLEMKRIKGVRLFELFHVLDELAQEGLQSAADAKERLLLRCNNAQKPIWNTLYALKSDLQLTVYPKSKIKDMLIELAHSIIVYYPNEVLDFSIEELQNEADTLYQKFERYAQIPFRDSTIKNMAINIEALDGIDHITTEAAKDRMKEEIRNFLSRDNFDKYNIIDFDFSSCKNLTTIYDDYIGLNLHESTYNLKTENHILETYSGNEEFAISLFVRYLRFAGRKRLYRLLCPTFHDIRFKYDDEKFYFRKFIYLIDKLDSEFQNNYRNIYSLFCTLSRLPNISPKFDMNMSLHSLKTKPWLGLWKPE